MDDFRLLEQCQAVVLDLDGVVWRGETPLPGVPEFFDFAKAAGIPFALATNNSTHTVDTYIMKLARVGIEAGPEHIVTSAVATAQYLRKTYGDEPIRVHLVGESGLYEIMLEAGYPTVMSDPDVVVVGMDRDVTYAKLSQAMTFILNGARFIGTNSDRTFPLPDRLAPGSGTLLAALEAATGQEPFIIGKPRPVMFEMAAERLGVPAAQVLMVGDRLETDIVGGQNAGMHTAVVFSGVTTPDLLAQSAVQPDMAFDSLADLMSKWQACLV